MFVEPKESLSKEELAKLVKHLRRVGRRTLNVRDIVFGGEGFGDGYKGGYHDGYINCAEDILTGLCLGFDEVKDERCRTG